MQAHTVKVESAQRFYDRVTQGDWGIAMAMLDDLCLDVSYRDVGGMTPLHRAARVAHVKLVEGILARDSQTANLVTFTGRAPALVTPLGCLASASYRTVNADGSRQVIDMLVPCMTKEAIMKQNDSGNTLFHVAATQANIQFLAPTLAACLKQFGKEVLVAALNLTNSQGKSVKDAAMYNSTVRNLVDSYDGINIAPPPDNWAPRLPKGHIWQRSAWQW